jgi:cell shape-determining protein MreC
VLLVVTLAAATLITLDARGVIALSAAREGATDVLSPVRGAVRWVTTPFRNGWNGITGYEDLQRENEELRAELQELEGRRWADQDAAEELARLEEQLGISYLRGLETQIARVTTGPYSNFTDHTLQLDRGRDAGLAVGMPVEPRELVVTGGIERSIMPPGNQIPVGTVSKVTPDEAARVQTLQIDYAVDFGELDVVQVVEWVPES